MISYVCLSRLITTSFGSSCANSKAKCIKCCRTHLRTRTVSPLSLSPLSPSLPPLSISFPLSSLSLSLSLSLLRLSYKSQQFLGLGLSVERANRQSPVAPRGPITRRPWYTTTKERRNPFAPCRRRVATFPCLLNRVVVISKSDPPPRRKKRQSGSSRCKYSLLLKESGKKLMNSSRVCITYCRNF